ncbi:MAG: UDP-2,3-diacylglucosamine diphosphatase [Duodenibacillus sp.]|nr:UDP-2,3-diacylglucosamine diphosphatase [Duodenibacillus sp.]
MALPEPVMARGLPVPAQAGAAAVPPPERPVFVSDLHLSLAMPRTLLGFRSFLRREALGYRELFILGDLFAYWVGDDFRWLAGPVTGWLTRYAATGRKLYIMQGNRDVMLGRAYAERCGATLLASQVAIDAPAGRILLAHGDEWCTLDRDYQDFRAMLRDPAWQARMLSITVRERIAWARSARAKSVAGKKAKSAALMDVVPGAIARDAAKFGARLVIHGHTHKPAAHTDEAVPRWVIPDWDLDRAPRRSGWVELGAGGEPRLVIR